MYVLECFAEALVLLGFGLCGTNGFTWYAFRHLKSSCGSAKGVAKTIEVSVSRELGAVAFSTSPTVAFQRRRHQAVSLEVTTSRTGTATS